MRARLVVAVSAVLVVGLLAWWLVRARRAAAPPVSTESSPVAVFSTDGTSGPASASASAPTAIYAHNLMLRKGSTGFRVYVRWLRGQMARTSRNVNPSFDEPDSFVLDVKTGVVHTNVGDLANFLNDSVTNSPLKNIKLTGDGDQLKVSGTFRKILPIEAIATIGVAPDNRIQMHVTKINVLKLPFQETAGRIERDGCQPVSSERYSRRGSERQRCVSGYREGGAAAAHSRATDQHSHHQSRHSADLWQRAARRNRAWRNGEIFCNCRAERSISGKLTMRHVDLIMVDLSNNAWFDLDLTNYQDQLVNGYTRMTPEAGLQIFMPSLDQIPAEKKNHSISMEWLKHRNLPPPSDITSR